VFFGELSLQVFAYILNRVVCYRCSLYILDINLLSVVCFANALLMPFFGLSNS
jgi:hypothetical protein